jgi:hypothetical protein
VLAKFIWKTEKAISYKTFFIYRITRQHNLEQHNVLFRGFGNFRSHSESVSFHLGVKSVFHTHPYKMKGVITVVKTYVFYYPYFIANFILFITCIIEEEFTILNQQNVQNVSLDINIIISH